MWFLKGVLSEKNRLQASKPDPLHASSTWSLDFTWYIKASKHQFKEKKKKKSFAASWNKTGEETSGFSTSTVDCFRRQGSEGEEIQPGKQQ